MRSRTPLAVTMVLLALVTGACTGDASPSTSTIGTTMPQPSAASDSLPVTCPESDVGVSPPGEVVVVGVTEVSVPFDAWQCVGRNVDNFVVASDYPVVTTNGSVTVRFDPTGVTAVEAVLTANNDRVELLPLELEPGLIQLDVPEPDLEWTLRLRIDAEGRRVAWYVALLVPE